MDRLIVLFGVFLVIVEGWAQTTSVDRCINSGGPTPLNVYVQGCTNPPCLVPQLEDLVVDVTFAAPREISQMTTQVTASLNFMGVQINVPVNLGDNAQTCNFLTLPSSCPIQDREIVQYRFKWRIGHFFPAFSVTDFEIRTVDNDSNNAVIWCIRLRILVLAPLPAVSSGNGEGNPSPILIVDPLAQEHLGRLA